MDPQTRYWDQTKALKDPTVIRVRGVHGVAVGVRGWALGATDPTDGERLLEEREQ